jgi:hypothetical protein
MDIHSYRELYGDNYISLVGDLVIPWKPLSIGQHNHYQEQFDLGRIPESVLEDEIFKSCCLDVNFVSNINTLSAGIVSRVARDIFAYSGISSVEEFENLLNAQRIKAQKLLYECCITIISAFSCYTLEYLLALKKEEFMLLLALAEGALIKNRILTAPISLEQPKQEKEVVKRKKIVKESLKKLWEDKNTPVKKKTESPIFKANGELNIVKNLETDRVETENVSGSPETGKERLDMIRQAAHLYSDVIAKLPYYNKN